MTRRYIEVGDARFGDPIVSDGIKYRVRDRIASGLYIVAVAGPSWRRDATRELRTGALAFDRRAAVWRPLLPPSER